MQASENECLIYWSYFVEIRYVGKTLWLSFVLLFQIMYHINDAYFINLISLLTPESLGRG